MAAAASPQNASGPPLPPSFVSAARHVAQVLSKKLTKDDLLALYGLYKQATQGPCALSKPTNAAILDKWQAWHDVSDLTREQAAVQYIHMIMRHDPSWTPDDTPDTSTPSKRTAPPPQSPLTSPETNGNHRGASLATPTSDYSTTGILEGVLYKQRDVFKTWRARHFKLDDQMLSYYLENPVNDPAPRSSMYVENCRVTAAPPATSGTNGQVLYPFMVSHPESSVVYKLAAADSETRDKWIEALSDAARPSGRMASFSHMSPSTDLLANAAPSAVSLGVRPRDVPPELANKVDELLKGFVALAGARGGGQWQNLGVKLGISGFSMGGSRVMIVKSVGRVPLNAYGVFKAVVGVKTRAGFDPMVEDCKRAHVFGRHTACDVTTLKAVWPTVPRDMLHLVHWRRITEGSAAEGGGSGDAQTRSSVVVLNFSVAPNMPSMAGVPTAVNSKAIRADLKLGGWLIRPIDSGYSEVVYIAQCDLKSSSTKGALSSSVMKQMSQQHAFLAAALRRAVESKQINLGDVPSFTGQMSEDKLSDIFDTACNEAPRVPESGSGNMTGGLASSPSPASSSSSSKRPAEPHASTSKSQPRSKRAADSSSPPKGSSGKGAAATAAPSPKAQQGGLPRNLSSQASPQRLMSNNLLGLRPPTWGADKAGLTSGRLTVLLLPTVAWMLLSGTTYRGLAFVISLYFVFRYIVRIQLGDPIAKRCTQTDWGRPVGGTVVFRFPAELKRLLRYLETKRQETGVETNVTHLTMKAAAMALQEMATLNGHLCMGRFYPSETSDISYFFPLSSGGFASVCIDNADKKPVHAVARELRESVERVQLNQDPSVRRRREILTRIPYFLLEPVEKLLGFCGAQLGLNIPVFGVRAFPFGTCTVITPPSEGADVEVDIIGNGEFATQPMAPVVITVGGIQLQSGYMKDKQMAARPVLHMSAAVDLRCATVYEAKQLFERLQQLMRDPILLDRYDDRLAKQKQA